MFRSSSLGALSIVSRAALPARTSGKICMTELVGDDRCARAKLLYVDTALSVPQIAARVGAHERTITRWACKQGWPRRPMPQRRVAPPPGETDPGEPSTSAGPARPANVKRSRKALVSRLYALIDQNITLLENRMSDDNPSQPKEAERDMRAINSAVRTVEKLKDLEPDQSKRDAPADGARANRSFLTPDEEDDIRRKVVEHILRLRERKRREGGDGGDTG